jgi:putative FmdB family regulatory protein
MPIYAYRCEACGFVKDVLQKVSDPQLTDCLSCGKPAFKKQLTAAGFQLKGTGWYATDFRNGAGTAAPATDTKPDAAAETGAVATPATTAAPAAAPAAPAPGKSDASSSTA